MTTAIITSLIQKTSDYDKDERYMATNDLCNHLTNELKMDEALEKKLCSAILKQLDDKSNDVQSVAVKCLGLLVKKVRIAQLIDISDKLCSLILEGSESLRDIYSIGLKTLISDVVEDSGKVIAERLVPRITQGISKSQEESVLKECLDNMGDLLRRFGHFVSKDHDAILNCVVTLLNHEKPLIRKRAATCLSFLAAVASEELFALLIKTILDIKDTKTRVQIFGSFSRIVGHRLGRFLDQLIPMFLRSCGDPEDENHQNDAANELREYCFYGLESIVLRCRKEVSFFVDAILQTTLLFVKYDPNYMYDDDNQGLSAGIDDVDEMGYDDEENYAAEDDDGSWKVRKAAVKVIDALIHSRPDLLVNLFDSCGDLLISRIRDREEIIRLDVISTLTLFLSESQKHSKSPSKASMSPRAMKQSYSTVNILAERVSGKLNALVSASRQHMASTALQTKLALFGLFKQLTVLLNGQLESHLDEFVNWIDKSLEDKNQTLKFDALTFLKSLLETVNPVHLASKLPRIVDFVVKVSANEWHKVTAESLQVLSTIIVIAAPSKSSMETDDEPVLNQVTTLNIYRTILPRLEASDIDQEIKESAIATIGKLFRFVGDKLESELPTVLNILRKRLDNEVTRVATLRAVRDISASSYQLDISSFIEASLSDIATLLRQQSRPLKLTTLLTIDSLLTSSSAEKVDLNPILAVILQELVAIIRDTTDITLTQSAFNLILTILNKYPTSADSVISKIYPRLLEVVASSSIQGPALSTLVEIFSSLENLKNPALEFRVVFTDLYRSSTTTKQNALSIALCVAGITSRVDLATQDEVIQQFVADLSNIDAQNTKKQLTLFCLGEVAYKVNLRDSLRLYDLIVANFKSSFEDVRAAAAYAFGHVAMTAIDSYLPIVLEALNTDDSRHQYLLLSSLKEIIQLHSNESKSMESSLSFLLPRLHQFARTTDDSLRNMVAECLGALTVLHTSLLSQWLIEVTSNDESKLIVWVAVTALRHALSKQYSVDDVAWTTFTSTTPRFLNFLTDADLEVQKASLILVNSVVHHNSTLIGDHLADRVIPRLFEILKFKQEKVLDLGPFKHRVDEGLPLRKAALTCIESILDTFAEKLDMPAFLSLALILLVDKDEVKLQTQQILVKVSKISPELLSQSAELLVEPLEKTITKKVKEGVVGPEAERAQELIRSGIRVVATISNLEDIANNRHWKEFIERLNRAGVNITDEY